MDNNKETVSSKREGYAMGPLVTSVIVAAIGVCVSVAALVVNIFEAVR